MSSLQILLSLLLAGLAAASPSASSDGRADVGCAELDSIRQGFEHGPAADQAARLGRIHDGKIVVTMRELEGGKLKAGVAMFRIDAPADVVFDLLTDHEAFPGTIPFVTESRLREDGEGPIVYQHVDLPFPITNRFYEIRVERKRGLGSDGRCAESRWSYLEGSGNIDDTYGRWEVLELDSETTLVAYVAWVDAGGLVPDWAQNWASKRALPRLAQAIRKAAHERSGSQQAAESP